MLTPNLVVNAARAILLLGALSAAILMLGPFQGLEHIVGLGDKTAHAIAFGGLTAVAFTAFPRMRRSDLAWAALLLGGGVEAAQLFGGRSASLFDWLADGVGIGVIYGASIIEGVRKMARDHGEMSFAAIAQMDRRRPRRRVKATFASPPEDEASAGYAVTAESFAARAVRKFPSANKA
jgi:VanZ family protein